MSSESSPPNRTLSGWRILSLDGACGLVWLRHSLCEGIQKEPITERELGAVHSLQASTVTSEDRQSIGAFRNSQCLALGSHKGQKTKDKY